MGANPEAYVDTSALIAFADGSDSYHALFRRLFSDPPALLTSTLVVAEGHGWFLHRYDRVRALQFLAMVEAMTPLHVAAVAEAEQKGGIQMLRRYSDQDLTLTDAVGLHVMRQHRIKVCWSTDRHLGLNGVPLIIHQH